VAARWSRWSTEGRSATGCTISGSDRLQRALEADGVAADRITEHRVQRARVGVPARVTHKVSTHTTSRPHCGVAQTYAHSQPPPMPPMGRDTMSAGAGSPRPVLPQCPHNAAQGHNAEHQRIMRSTEVDQAVYA
jgi:hypothetical protein